MLFAAGWWHNNGVAVVSTTLGILVTVLVALIVVRYQRQTKTLDWALLSDEPIIATNKPPELEIRSVWASSRSPSPHGLTNS